MGYFLTIDLHGHTTESAKKALDTALKTLSAEVHEVEVVHGYHQGTALRDMVRRYKHPKIARKILGMNQGTTIFIIKQP
ncbi:MAG: Smr/MutS family protein [Acutalibacteraceae bacterium]|nr:Smr/MutS family protein [Clostridia bacterium]MEE3403025.1 Smr/MutS family protein [Acutalibacteraceae bacterium]